MRNYLGIDPAALDRHILASPFDNERPSEPRRLAESVPDRVVARALRREVSLTKKHLDAARRERDAAYRRSCLVDPKNADAKELAALEYRVREETARELRAILQGLCDVWRKAREQVRR